MAIGQIVAWGILYYAFAVVAGPLHDDTGWSRSFINAGLSFGLLVWGILAVPVGAWIQRNGARSVMCVSSAVGGLALVLMGTAATGITYIAAWMLLGAAMAGTLYDPAFAAVTQAFGSEYRRGITLITLVGGFASTAFIPLAQVMVNGIGWREALILLGVVQALIGVPLHIFGMPMHFKQTTFERISGDKPRFGLWLQTFRRDISDPRFVGLAVWFTAQTAAVTGLIFQLVPLLQSAAVPTSTILETVAVIGPMQVLGRFVLTRSGKEVSALQVGRLAMIALVAGVLVLLLLPRKLLWLSVFGALFGLGNGCMTIVRGVAIAELFGTSRYSELNGALAAPAVLAKAASPFALGALWANTSGGSSVIFAVLVLLLGAVCGLSMVARSIREAESLCSDVNPPIRAA